MKSIADQDDNGTTTETLTAANNGWLIILANPTMVGCGILKEVRLSLSASLK
jgi:hypothetical protein